MAADNSVYEYNHHNVDTQHSRDYRYYEPMYKAQPPERNTGSEPRPNITMKKAPPRRGSASKVFLIALSVFSICFFVISGKVETSKMYRQISSANKNLESVQSENVRLESELESKMTLKNVEEYAEQVLGLQKLNNSQIMYVETQTDDVVEIPEEKSNVFIIVKEKFDKVVEYIFG
jgi:hypothetical protein